jgi:hypothetical protein
MERGSTLFLRTAIVGIGLLVAAFCAAALTTIHREWNQLYPSIAYLRYPVLGALLASAVPFYAALHQGLKLLKYIDTDKAFSARSAQALRNIKRYALIISGMYAAAMPLIYYIGDKDDAPGLIVIGLVFMGAPFVAAVLAALAQRLLQNALDIKAENDLTV